MKNLRIDIRNQLYWLDISVPRLVRLLQYKYKHRQTFGFYIRSIVVTKALSLCPLSFGHECVQAQRSRAACAPLPAETTPRHTRRAGPTVLTHQYSTHHRVYTWHVQGYRQLYSICLVYFCQNVDTVCRWILNASTFLLEIRAKPKCNLTKHLSIRKSYEIRSLRNF